MRKTKTVGQPVKEEDHIRQINESLMRIAEALEESNLLVETWMRKQKPVQRWWNK